MLDNSMWPEEVLSYGFDDEGTWWMRYDDWHMNYNQVYVCKIFPAALQQFSTQSQWPRNAADGSHPQWLIMKGLQESIVNLITKITQV